MYVQCAMYLTLCRRWRAYNRVIMVQDAPARQSTVTVLNEASASSKGTKRKKGTAATSAATGNNLRQKAINKSITSRGTSDADSSALIAVDNQIAVVSESRADNSDVRPSTSKQPDD